MVDLRWSFWLTRVVFLRSLAFIYGVAFLVAYGQNKELIGDRGLLPLQLHLKKLAPRYKKEKFFPKVFSLFSLGKSFIARVTSVPTLLWLWEPWDRVDSALDGIALAGISLSTLVFITGSANAPLMASLWLLYHSLVNVGQRWYSFGWESQLLETGFLAIFAVPLFKWKALPEKSPSPWVSVAAYRWLLMRVN